jgi:hypothetical protein
VILRLAALETGRSLTFAGEYAGQISWLSAVAYLNLGGAGTWKRHVGGP